MEQTSIQPASLQPHSDVILTTVQAAVEGLKRKHPNATEEEIETFRRDVEANVRERQFSLTGIRDAKKYRRERSLAVNAEISKLGLKIGYVRSLQVVSIVDSRTGERFEVSSSMKPRGGFTAVYRVSEGKMTIAGALCSSDDNFDRLCGRELALERFKGGLTVTVEAIKIEQVNPEMLRQYYLNLLRKPREDEVKAFPSAWPFPTSTDSEV